MKFGIRAPSFKKRIGARISWKRFARHSLGVKAPRGWGWLTNPKKATYNRVYNRTSVSLDRLFMGGSKRRRRHAPSTAKSTGGGLVVILLVVACLLYTLARNMSAVQLSCAAFVLVGMSATVFWLKKKRKADAKAAEVAAHQETANELLSEFGSENAERIMKGELWEGATSEMVVAMLGSPAEVTERTLKTKTKRTYKYFPTGQNRYALQITLDGDIVVNWTDKRD